MKTKSVPIVLALIVCLTICVGPMSAAQELSVDITARSIGGLSSDTDLQFTALSSNTEEQATIAYKEETLATSGSINYTKELDLKTGGETNTLDVTRDIDYTNNGAGKGGRMTSEETVAVSEYSTETNGDESGAVCAFSEPSESAGQEEVITTTYVQAEAGSDVDLSEGSVHSTTNADVSSSVKMEYDVEVDASQQPDATENETAIGTAEVHVEVTEMGGTGSEPTQTSDTSYDEKVKVNGLIELSMETEYSAGA